jgi:hypothetical protein
MRISLSDLRVRITIGVGRSSFYAQMVRSNGDLFLIGPSLPDHRPGFMQFRAQDGLTLLAVDDPWNQRDVARTWHAL